MAGDEDHRQLDAGLGQLALKIEAAAPRQPDIEDQAAGRIGPLALQEFLRRAEGPHLQAHRA